MWKEFQMPNSRRIALKPSFGFRHSFVIRHSSFDLRPSTLVPGKSKFLHDFSSDQMLLDDALQHLRRAGVIPHGFGVHDRDGSVDADAQAIRFAAINHWLRTAKI